MSEPSEKQTTNDAPASANKDKDDIRVETEGKFSDYIRVFRYADRIDWTLNSIAFICAVASGASLPLMTIIFGSFTTKFNNFSTGGSPDAFQADVNRFVLWLIYLFIGRFMVTYIGTILVTISAIRTTRSLRLAFLEKTLRLEVWHFDKMTVGSTATQVTTNGNRINQGIAEKLFILVHTLSMFFSSFIVALTIQWKLSLIVMSTIPAIFIITGICLVVETKQESKILRLYSRAGVLAQEALSSVRTIHAFNSQSKMSKKYDEYLEKAEKIGRTKAPNWGVLFSTEYFFVYAAIALAFWQGYRMYASGEISEVGTVFTVVLSTTIAATAISTLAPQIFAMTNAASAATELFEIFDQQSQLDPLENTGKKSDNCRGEIEVKALDFAYPSRPTAQVLKGLNLSIPAGKTTALVGASGSGKSTLIGLLERWYLPSSGSITLDGLDIADYNIKWLRSQIRLVQQEPVLFRGTVFDNVAKGFLDGQRKLSPEDQMKLVREACTASNADEFIEQLPKGYHTEIGERAGMLSGGQKQRLAIARSIISDPKILLLDEATSALDPKAEKVVQDALNRVSANRTTLVIAHRLSTIKSADSIAVMSYGQLVEQGTHQELLALDGYYASLVRAQDLGAEDEGPSAVQDTKEVEAEVLEKTISLVRTKTNVSTTNELEAQGKIKESVDYSLIRCIIVMFAEQKSLYFCFFLTFIACLIGGATYPAQALLFARVLDIFTLQGQEAMDRANFYSLMFFVVALGQLVAYFTIGFNCNIISQTVIRRYRREMFETVLQQDMDFFDRSENTSGALTSKLSNYPTQLQELISANVLLIFIIIVNILSSSILAIAYGWKLGLVVVFGGLPVLLAAGLFRIRLETRLENKVGDRFSESASLATEMVTSIRTVASLALEKQILDEYSQLMQHIVRQSIRSLFTTMFLYALSQSLDFLVMALGFWYGSRLLAYENYTTTQFYIIFIGVLFAGQAAGQFFGYSTSITKATVAANYILWLRTLRPTICETDQNKDKGPPDDGAIALQDVEFRYRQREASRVLRGISMKIEPGQFVAYVGPSGCGKSTLIALLERFYDPISGRICFNEQDIKDMSPRLYRKHMSLVQQEPTLYQGSVRENVALGLDYEPSEEQINEACRQANAYDFVISLPEGFDTPCGTRGIAFSGGQRQRIAIARALIRNPKLLLLDEATSALDTQSERLVQATLDEAASSRTTIAVAHRLSTIRNADVIFVFAHGKIAEMGTHIELQRLRGRYYEMCLAQSLDKAV